MTIITIPNGIFQVNTFLIINNSQGILIDPGEDYKKIENTISKHQCSLCAIINTHGHVDHVTSVSYFKDKYSLPFYMHSDDQYLLDYHKISSEKYNLHYFGTPKIDVDLKNKEQIKLIDLKICIIFTPGHTPGGVVLLIDNFALSGDTLFNRSIGRTDFPGGDYSELENSIKEKIYTLPDNVLVYPGHGPTTTVGEEKTQNPFIHL